jgi:SPP1 gp7 family putative phage head morphogenesis protein
MPLPRRRGDKNPNEKVLRPLRPNLGLEVAYRNKIEACLEAMHDSVLYWVRAAYRANEPEMAMDRPSPAIELRKAIRGLARRWTSNYAEMAPKLARWFATAACRRSDLALRKILKDGGIAVELRMTAGARDILQATIAANVALIRSIPSQYFTQIEGMVMRSVQTGRDVKQLTDELQAHYRVTRDRAVLIARDQNSKATSAIQEARRKELGIEEAIWMHSHGGKEPRRTHLANHGKRYSVADGWYDPDPRVRRRIHPGELINCRCVSRSVVPGFA